MVVRMKRYVIPGDPISSMRHYETAVWDETKFKKILFDKNLAEQHGDEALFSGPLAIDIKFYCQLPTRSITKSRYTRHAIQPSLRYLAQFIFINAKDVLWSNCCSISLLHLEKHFDHDPRTEITISQLEKLRGEYETY